MNNPKQQRSGVSVIITTYNRTDALECVLSSLQNQTHIPDEIIIADDGSTEETAKCIKQWQQQNLPLKHCWQEDKGFRAGGIRNKAVSESTGEYIIFLDGDCIVFPDFVEKHLSLAERHWLLVGNRILMSQQLTDETIHRKQSPLKWNFSNWIRAISSGNVNRITPLLNIPLAHSMRKFRPSRWKGAHSCNLGIWADDFIRVNGFDEAYQGWGHEDADLVCRLFKSGIKRKDGHFSLAVLHLWHKIHPRDREIENRERLADILDGQRPIFCQQGIQQHVSDHLASPREPLSITIISKNAGLTLSKCLNSVQFADEIIVVDSGSTDNTEEIAKQYNAKFIKQDWLGFGLQKQFAVEQAKHQWVLSIDADEWVSESLKINILEALRSPKTRAYQFPRCNRFMGRWLRHGEGYPDYKLRLFHKQYVSWSDDAVHEKLVTTETVETLNGDLMHESAKEGLTEYIEKQNQYTRLQAKILQHDRSPPSVFRMLLSPLVRFLKFYFVKGGFKDGLPGLIHTIIGCNNAFLKQAKLFELKKK